MNTPEITDYLETRRYNLSEDLRLYESLPPDSYTAAKRDQLRFAIKEYDTILKRISTPKEKP